MSVAIMCREAWWKIGYSCGSHAKTFCFQSMGSGSEPSSPRAQEEEGGVTLIHLLSVLRSVLFGLDHDALSLFCSRPEAEICRDCSLGGGVWMNSCLAEPASHFPVHTHGANARRVLKIGRVVMKWATKNRHGAMICDVSQSQKCNFHWNCITSKFYSIQTWQHCHFSTDIWM